MIFDTEAAILAHLATKCAPGSVLLGTFDPIDLTDDSSHPVAGQILLLQIQHASDVRGCAASVLLQYGFSVYCDVARASSAQKTAAAALFNDASNALVAWEYAPMRHPQITDGQATGFDGRILRLSFGFALPAYFGQP